MAKSPQPKLSGHRPSAQIPRLPASPLYTTTKGDPSYPSSAADVPNQFSPTDADPRSRHVKYGTSE